MISCRARFLTNAETWLYHYDPETKQLSMECRHSGTTRPKIIHVQKSTSKILTYIFSDQDVIFLIDYLPNGQTINAESYSSLLVQMKDILMDKHHMQEDKQEGHVLARQCPGSPVSWNPRETGLPGLPIS